MSEKVQLKGCVCELNFGYNAKMEGDTTLMSDIPELDEMPEHSYIYIDLIYIINLHKDKVM